MEKQTENPRTISVVADSYAFGQITTGPPEAIDDPRKWQRARVPEETLLKKYGITAEELRAWRDRFNFPAPARDGARTIVGSWRLQVCREWDVEVVSTWERSIRDVAAKLPPR